MLGGATRIWNGTIVDTSSTRRAVRDIERDHDTNDPASLSPRLTNDAAPNQQQPAHLGL